MIGDGANDCMDCELSLLQSSCDTLSAVTTELNQSIDQFVYRDNTSHDNYNRIVTRQAASKA